MIIPLNVNRYIEYQGIVVQGRFFLDLQYIQFSTVTRLQVSQVNVYNIKKLYFIKKRQWYRLYFQNVNLYFNFNFIMLTVMFYLFYPL